LSDSPRLHDMPGCRYDDGLFLLFALLVALTPGMSFSPPDRFERVRAIGSTRSLDPVVRAAFEPGNAFEPAPVPKPGDWLAEHAEEGQTFDAFVREGWSTPTSKRNKLYLQPLGEFAPDASPSVEALRDYAAAFFCMHVVVLPPLPLRGSSLTARVNEYTGKRQILTTDVCACLRDTLPPDAFCMLGITMEDLYPDASWNFVFGQASLRERVGVYSFARYDPAFYGEERGRGGDVLVLRRSCKVLAHEICHMFGLQHCIYYSCVMNGSNHLHESDSRPLHLCPVCLRKMHHSVGFNIVGRYRKLQQQCRKAGFDDEARWPSRRIEQLEPAE
jgi:archaemetzincin